MANRIVLNETSYHGAGAIAEIAGVAKSRGFKKAFVCSDPDLDGPGKMDRSIAGRSIIALLPVLEISDVSTTLGLDISRGNSAGEFNELRVSTPPP